MQFAQEHRVHVRETGMQDIGCGDDLREERLQEIDRGARIRRRKRGDLEASACRSSGESASAWAAASRADSSPSRTARSSPCSPGGVELATHDERAAGVASISSTSWPSSSSGARSRATFGWVLPPDTTMTMSALDGLREIERRTLDRGETPRRAVEMLDVETAAFAHQRERLVVDVVESYAMAAEPEMRREPQAAGAGADDADDRQRTSLRGKKHLTRRTRRTRRKTSDVVC